MREKQPPDREAEDPDQDQRRDDGDACAERRQQNPNDQDEGNDDEKEHEVVDSLPLGFETAAPRFPCPPAGGISAIRRKVARERYVADERDAPAAPCPPSCMSPFRGMRGLRYETVSRRWQFFSKSFSRSRSARPPETAFRRTEGRGRAFDGDGPRTVARRHAPGGPRPVSLPARSAPHSPSRRKLWPNCSEGKGGRAGTGDWGSPGRRDPSRGDFFTYTRPGHAQGISDPGIPDTAMRNTRLREGGCFGSALSHRWRDATGRTPPRARSLADRGTDPLHRARGCDIVAAAGVRRAVRATLSHRPTIIRAPAAMPGPKSS